LNAITRGKAGGISLTQNEKSVVDNAVKERTNKAQKEKAVNEKANQLISEKESTFGTLNNAEKQNIKDKVIQQLDNGEIDYTKSILNKNEINKITEEVKTDLLNGNFDIESIENTLAGATTSRIKALETQLEQTTNEEEKGQIQAQISELKTSKDNELMSMLKNDNLLQNSYREAKLKSQKFVYEVQDEDSDYKKKIADEFIKKANNSTKSHQTFEMLSKLADDRQAQYHITNNDELAEMGYSIEGKTINGLVNKNGEVLINIDSDNAINRILGHETTHLFEGTQEHTELKEMVKQFATTKGEYNTRFKEMQRLYNGTNANIEDEVTSELVGDYLFTDADFINNLSTGKPNIFKKIYEEIKHLYKFATSGSKEARELEKVKKVFDKAYKNTTAKSDGVFKYSITYTTENKPIVVIDENILDGVSKNDWIATVKNIINEKFSAGIPVKGRLIKVNAVTRDEYPKSKNSQHYKRYDKVVYKDKFKSANNLDEIIIASTNYINEDLKHERKDNFVQFARGDVLMRIGENDYSAKVIVGFTSGNSMVLYDVIDFIPTRISIKKADAHAAQSQYAKNNGKGASTDTTISQDKNDVNNSISQNSENSVKLFLKNPNTQIAPTKNDIFGSDIKYQGNNADTATGKDLAPVKTVETSQDIASIKETSKLETEQEPESTYKKTRKELRKSLIENESSFFEDALDNAKNIPVLLLNNTDTIRSTELVFGRKEGNIINSLIFQPALDNEADSIKWQNQQRQDIKDLGIKAKSKESAAVQKYGEGVWMDESGQKKEYGDMELAKEFKDAKTRKRIRRAATVIRNKYDNYIDKANNVLTSLGFEPIKKRNDYMRHFQELTDVFSMYGIPFNSQNMQENNLPTDINGLTEFWTPQKNYFANMQPRTGTKTTYDAITGIDGYIGGISNLIFHTEDIQRGRAFEETIRETFGQDKKFNNLENLSEELKQERSKKIQDNHLSGYAAWVRRWTNNIAGKKNTADRVAEELASRTIFSFFDQVRKQVGANMVGFNLSSPLTNLIAPVQAASKTNKLALAKGTADAVKNIFVKDGFADKNKFLTSRMGTDMLSKNAWQKMQGAGFIFMKGIDSFASNQIVRSKYYELKAKGMSEEQSHAEAGKFAARIMGDRTKGANAQLYNSKLINMAFQFQLEVNNQLYSMFYDTYHESKEVAQGNALEMAAGMTFTLGQLFAYTHVFGQTFKAIAGYNPTFDVIEMMITAFGWDDDDDSDDTVSDNLKQAFGKLCDALPYVNLISGGGRIPLTNAIPNFVAVGRGDKDQYGNERTVKGELKKLQYLALPTGGNQIKKTYNGLKMFDKDLSVSGSYTDSGNMRFPVEDTVQNRIQASLFGQYANENARNYFDNERAPLKKKQIEEFKELDIPIADYWKYRSGLKDKDKLNEKFDYIDSMNVSDKQKNIMVNNVVNRDKPVDMSNYSDFGNYEEFDFATKNKEKYDFLKSNGVSYKSYSKSDESKEAYDWAFNNPESYAVSNAVTNDVVSYRQYTSDLNELKADKYSSGKSISGSRKEKVVDYINNLDADYGAKLILYKTEYSSDDSVNNDIVEYLNNREDINYQQMKTILIKLGMTVDQDGNINW